MTTPACGVDGVAPVLTSRDLESLLREVASQEHSELVTVYGRGCNGLRVEAGGTSYAVHEVGSELELRAQLPPLTEPITQRLAFVVPWRSKLPSDIAGEFKWNGQPRVIRLRDRVARLFGAHSASAELDQSALPAYLLAYHADIGEHPGPPVVGVLSRRQLWELFLARGLGVDTGGSLSLEPLLAWVARNQGGPQVRGALEARGGSAVRSELLEELRSALGPLGPVAWQAWERGEGRRLLEFGLLFEIVRGVDSDMVRYWVRRLAAPALGLSIDDRLESTVAELGRVTGSVLRWLQRSDGDGGVAFVRAVLQGAEHQLAQDESVFGPHVTKSVWLPTAAEHLLVRMGNELAVLSDRPGSEGLTAARATFELLGRHRAFDDPVQRVRLERAEMALRLGAWLCAPNHDTYVTSTTSFADVEALGRWYTEEGGFLDWARRVARGGASDAFGAGVQAVVTRVDALRCTLDLRFARALAAWLEAGRPSAGVIPIESAVERLVEPFLAERAERKLLILLMDGMAWSQAVQLLAALAPSGWGPIRWRPAVSEGARRANGGAAYAGLYPPVLADLPTMTEVSRAAFFAGARLPAGKAAPPTSEDTKRWARHSTASRFDQNPCLLLEGTGHATHGSVSTLALKRIEDDDQRVVAVVINAIDDSLKGSTQTHTPWHPENIRSLPELLLAAERAGRSILLASDHGHVPGDCLTHYVASPESGGARWRPLRASNDTFNPEFEVRIPASQVCAPEGATAVALLADDGHRYTRQVNAGEHGGATLAEVIAPCVLIGRDAGPSVALGDDPSIELRAQYVPEWWLYNVPKAPARRLSKKPSRPRVSVASAEPPFAPAQHPVPPPTTGPQASQPQAARPPAPQPQAAPPPPATEVVVPVRAAGASTVSEAALRITQRLLENETFKRQLPGSPQREPLLRALQYLWDSNGEVRAQGLASAVDQPVLRIFGLVATLARVVNVDGYAVVRAEAATGTVHFERELLCQLFEVQA